MRMSAPTPAPPSIAARALEARIRSEAKSIAENYLAAPHTTDFAILFLPVESLYAEVLRRPGLMDAMQRQHRVTLAGPTTLLAMLNSLHMGFRTLALEQQASEVWKVLGAVKTEFERYGEWVARIKEQVAKASDTLDKADTRAKQMRLALRKVEALPEAQSQALLPAADDERRPRRRERPSCLRADRRRRSACMRPWPARAWRRRCWRCSRATARPRSACCWRCSR